MKTKLDRREFLRMTAAGASLGLFPASIARALSIKAANVTGTIKDVKHVVILMQENRSFDHYFGVMPGVRGFGDRFTIPQPNGGSVLAQSDGTRTVLPYYLDSTQGNALTCGGAHSWSDAHAAWDSGRMTAWPAAKGEVSMGYLKESDMSFQYALASAFTICDSYHCSLHGGTNSNRIHLFTGTNGGTSASSNGQRVAVINNDGWDGTSTTPLADSLTWTTYPERLQAAGITWKVYQNLPDNYTDNSLAGFLNYRNCYQAVNGNLTGYSSGVSVPWTEAIDATQPLYKGIGNTLPTDYGEYFQEIAADIAAGTLPQVSWVVGSELYCEHPGISTPGQGAYFIQQLLDVLTLDPATWSETVFIVNYDENDCFFDHMPPPNPPSQNPDGSFAGQSTVDTSLDYFTVPSPPGGGGEPSDGLPYGPGPRVPMFVISPWSQGGIVNSQAFDHTSVLRFLEQCFGVEETNISPWRRTVFGDLTSAFNFATPNDNTPSLPLQIQATAAAQYAEQDQAAAVPVPSVSAQTYPVQPMGTLPSSALPYVLNVTAAANAASGVLSLAFSNTGTVGAVFHVYDRLNIANIPRRYTVEAGKSLTDAWTVSAGQGLAYDLWVLGPNGFHRLFRGVVSTTSATIGLEVTTAFDATNNVLSATFINGGSAAAAFVVTPNAYMTAGPSNYVVPAQSHVTKSWPLSSSAGWYDLTVRSNGGFTRRFAGRVETGANSTSDPAFGAAEVPDPFTFTEQDHAAPSTFVTSPVIALSGFPGYLPISISGGTNALFSIDGGAFVTSAPAVCTGQTLQVGQNSSATLGMPSQTTLTVGSYSTMFVVNTTTDATGSSSGGTSGGSTSGGGTSGGASGGTSSGGSTTGGASSGGTTSGGSSSGGGSSGGDGGGTSSGGSNTGGTSSGGTTSGGLSSGGTSTGGSSGGISSTQTADTTGVATDGTAGAFGPAILAPLAAAASLRSRNKKTDDEVGSSLPPIA